jgi:hypothetical protein
MSLNSKNKKKPSNKKPNNAAGICTTHQQKQKQEKGEILEGEHTGDSSSPVTVRVDFLVTTKI